MGFCTLMYRHPWNPIRTHSDPFTTLPPSGPQGRNGIPQQCGVRRTCDSNLVLSVRCRLCFIAVNLERPLLRSISTLHTCKPTPVKSELQMRKSAFPVYTKTLITLPGALHAGTAKSNALAMSPAPTASVAGSNASSQMVSIGFSYQRRLFPLCSN